MNWMTFCIQGDGSNDRPLVFRAKTCLASLAFSAKTGVIHLPTEEAFYALAHRT
jgi:hypothetical protein